ncbi:MAG: MBL fold metallo-hydrolase [Deltaproteobacteria bacterium]|nr:MBL fold metallo-hydrolase [Candidatus Deferrimicrobium borealis]
MTMLKDERFGRATFTRRDALKIAGAAGVMAALPWSGIPEAEAAAPALKGPQAGGYYRFAIGEIEAVVISDGGLSFQPIQPTWAPEASKEELEGTLRSAFLPTDRLNLDVNTLLLKIGGELVLVDSGAGGLYGPSLGKVRERLSAAGVEPSQVTGVVLTHAHGDHFGGLLDGDGKPVFPNAAYFASKTEVDYWTGSDPDMSKLRVPEENKKVFAANAKRYLGAIKDRLTPVSPGQKIVPGLEVVSAPGHTPGHIALLVSSGKEALLHAVDTVHHHKLMFAHPEWTSAFDSDPKMGADTRRKILDRSAADGLRVLGYHLPFPGIGHVRAVKGGGFEWVPEPWNWTS